MRPVEAESFHGDGQTDDEANNHHFPNFFNAPENSTLSQNNCEYRVLTSSCLSERKQLVPERTDRPIQFRSKCDSKKNHFTEFMEHKFQQ